MICDMCQPRMIDEDAADVDVDDVEEVNARIHSLALRMILRFLVPHEYAADDDDGVENECCWCH